MAYDDGNVFARILRGELPCHRIHEDAATLAFLDIMPQAEGHTLVIPKERAESLLDLSPGGAAALIQTTQRVARAVKAAMGVPGLMIAQLTGAAAGQTVFHVHMHIIPRVSGIDLKLHARGMEAPETLAATAARIRAALT